MADETQQRRHDIGIEIDAPPEAVWKAVSEGGEMTKWLAPQVRVTPGLGGSVLLSWGPGMEGEAPIRVWEPGKRYAWVEREGSGNPRTVEFSIGQRAPGGGGKTMLRLVHSGFGAGADVDAEYESTHGGWHSMLALLKDGLERFPGAPAVNVTVMRFFKMPTEEAWRRLTGPEALALATSAEGEPTTFQLAGNTTAARITRAVQPGYACLATADSAVGLFVENGGPGQAVVTIQWILFGDEAIGRAGWLRDQLASLLDAAEAKPPKQSQ